MTRHGRAAFAFVYITVLLDMIALGIVVPVLPKLIVQLEHGEMSAAARQVGVFGFIFAAMQFLFAPVIGSLSDHFGRRLVILLSNFGLGVDYLIMAMAPTVSWLFAGRLISGITCASFPTASAYVADITPEQERAAKFGMLGSAFGLGFIIGPAIGGLVGAIDLRYPFWAAGILSLLNTAYGFFILPESLAPELRTPFAIRKANPLGSLTMLRSHPELAGLAIAMFLYYMAHESLPTMWVLYTDYRYHWSEQLTGFALAAVGASSTIVSAVLIGWVTAKIGTLRTAFAGLIFGVAGFAIYGGAATTAMFFVGFPLVALWGLSGPSLQSLMSIRTSATEQGRLQGALGSLFGIAGMIAPILFTQIFAVAIAPRRSVQYPGTPFTLAALFLAGSLMIAWSVTRGQRYSGQKNLNAGLNFGYLPGDA